MFNTSRAKSDCTLTSIFRLALLALIVIASAGFAACGGDDGPQAEDQAVDAQPAGEQDGAPPEEGAESTAGEERAPESAGDRAENAPDAGVGDRPGAGGEGPYPSPEVQEVPEDERGAVAGATARYVEALTMRRGKRLCSQTFVRGALDGVRLPAKNESCAATLEASIGSAMQNGGPRWRGATLKGMNAVIVSETGDARVTAGVANRMRGNRRAWLEDDVIYLRKTDENDWRVVKPSATFYRAVGYGNVPIRALAPPS